MNARAYYNENDPRAAAWLRELIRRGLIANGDVDERSIIDVRAGDVAGYTQCHWFAGIGGWSYALRLAGWPDARAVWTASLPCQPFSAAGKQEGEEDARHLFPVFRALVAECAPDRIFGEQVASAVGFGWIDRVRADLEAAAYILGIAVLGAHSAGAPHIRQRLYWVADAALRRCGIERGAALARRSGHAHGGNGACGMGNADEPGREAQRVFGIGENARPECIEKPGPRSHWAAFDLLPCTDGKARRIESGTFPLAHGVPARMGRLRGYGNAIVPQTAAEFIGAYLDICN